MRKYFKFLLVAFVFYGSSPVKASEIEDYFDACSNNLWKQNNVKIDGSAIPYQWVFGNNPNNRLYKIEKYKDNEIIAALFTSENIQKYIDLESIGNSIWIATKRPFSRIEILNAVSSEIIEDLIKKYKKNNNKIKNSVFIFIEDENGNFNGQPTKPVIKKLLKNDESNDLQVFTPNVGCVIERQANNYDIMQTFGHVSEKLDSENKLRCIATIIYTHYGISNPELFYHYKKLASKTPELGDGRFSIGIDYVPLYGIYPSQDNTGSLPRVTGCESWNRKYMQSKQSCQSFQEKIGSGNHDYGASYVEHMRNDCKKFSIEIK